MSPKILIESILLKATCTPILTIILLISKQMYRYKYANTYNITYPLRLTFMARWIYLLCQLKQNRQRKTACKVSTCGTKVKHIEVENMAVRNWRCGHVRCSSKSKLLLCRVSSKKSNVQTAYRQYKKYS